MNEGIEARRYLRGCRHGVLSTVSKRLAGYPFGSITPFMLDHAARPVMLISTLAEHTKNIIADPRVSLLVHDATVDDVQAAARLTVIGDAAPFENSDEIRQRYLRYQPQAEPLLALGDFSFYRIAPLQLRFIGGFGKIHWVSKESFAPPENPLAEQEDDILNHMNADHADNLREYCRHFKNKTAENVVMAGIDCEGFDIRADGELLRFDFEELVLSAGAVRKALVEMAKQTRL